MRNISLHSRAHLLLAFACLCGCGPSLSPLAPAPRLGQPSPFPIHAAGIEEPSGVTRSGDRLFFVGDDEHGSIFTMPLTRDETLGTKAPHSIPLDPARLLRMPIATRDAAFDLEGVAVLADGRPVVLSEARRALFDEGGVVASYGHSLVEFGGRGLEGVAARPLGHDSTRVAVLWEGGYPAPEESPLPLREATRGTALQPFILVHDLAAGAHGAVVLESAESPAILLQVPVPVGDEPAAQRFRAPDFVWYTWQAGGVARWGFIVLLSSGPGADAAPGSPEECGILEEGAPRRYCYKWLQRFDDNGAPVGKPVDLDPFLPEAVRTANWEGLSWYEAGKSLVLVYDEKLSRKRVDPQIAVVVPLPDGW